MLLAYKERWLCLHADSTRNLSDTTHSVDICLTRCSTHFPDKLPNRNLCKAKSWEQPSLLTYQWKKDWNRDITTVSSTIVTCEEVTISVTLPVCREAVQSTDSQSKDSTLHRVPFREFESKEQRTWIRQLCKACRNCVCSLDAASSQVNSTKASAPALKWGRQKSEFSQHYY